MATAMVAPAAESPLGGGGVLGTAASGGHNRAVVRFLPSFTDVAFLAPLLFLFVGLSGARQMLGDGDTGWHIRTGEWILKNGRVPDRDIFSYTRPGEPWFAWEWLWDALFGWIHGQLGMAAVIWVSTLVIAATFALVYRIARRQCGNPVIAIVLALVAGFASSIHWLARPHLFTWLFVAVFLIVLERAQSGQTRALLYLPPLTILWTNLHGGFVAGIILLGCHVAGELGSWAIDNRPDARALAIARARRYAVCMAACMLASLANPYGYKLHTHIFRYLTDPFLFEHVQEFLSLNFQHPVGKYFEAMILLGAAAVGWNTYHRRFTDSILLVCWAHLALMSTRNIPIYLIVATPPIARCVADLLELLSTADVAAWVGRAARAVERLGAEAGEIDRIGRIPVISVSVMVALFFALRTPASANFRAEYDATKYPAGAVALLQRPEYRTGLFTSDVWGGYLIYKLYPNLKVFIDGRSDFYGAKFDTKYLEVLSGKYTWRNMLDGFHVHSVLLPVDAPLASTLKESSRWRTVYDDGAAIMFRRAGIGTPTTPPAEGKKASAVQDSGTTAIARSRTTKPVIPGSQSYARR